MDLEIGRDTLVALAAVVWADGEMAPEEAQGIRMAAQQLGLQQGDLSAVESAIAQRITLDHVETIRMNRLTRLFTYAAAGWVVGLKGHVDAKEQEALRLLGDRLGLSNVARERAERAVQSVGSASAGAFDLMALRSKLSAGLSQVGLE
ncbi:MAG: hypothetical protein H6718_27870 [Polyangiaceae bacterium]|nr:hypothetical protein [Myxococcales bacterium]MCB9589264.1 hypothetical protein [Polyangiaceae bacterium]